jgi:hypothetical protein
VQLALSPWSADQATGTAAPQSARRNKLVMGGVVALGAAVIAVNPIAPNTAALDQLQHRAVALVAAATDSPAVIYQDLFTNTVTSLTGLGNQIATHPLPILSALVANQQGYATKVSNSFIAAGTAFQTWWNVGTRESPAGQVLLSNIQNALAAGDLGVAYDNFNKLALFGIQNTLLPILSGTIFTSGTNLGIPQQMAQNFADAIGAVLTTGTLVFGAFQSVYAPVSGALFEASRALGAVSTSLSTGDFEGAVNALINTPGITLDAFLNGFDYKDGDTTAPWAGFLSPPGTGARPTGGGPLQQFLVTIPGKIAAAILNTPVTPTQTTATTAAPLTSGVAATALPSESSASLQTFDLKVTDDAGEAAATASAAADDTDAAETVTKSAPGLKAVTTKVHAGKTAAASSDDSSSSSTKAGDSGPKHAKGSGAKSAKSAS